MSLRLPKIFLTGIYLALAGCVALPPKKMDMGIAVKAFTEKYGQPTSVIKSRTGERLVYSTGPFGEETYFVDTNGDGLVVAWQQVLTEENFKKISTGMPLGEVQNLLGPCSETHSLARNRGTVCSFRYRNPFCQWFSIEIAQEGVVRSAGYLPDPKCDDSHFGLFRFGF
jgi:hypothetical protein